MSALATRFGRNVNILQSGAPLENEQLFRVAPSIFAEAAHVSRSDRYSYIPTIKVLDGLRKEGFKPFYVAQSRTRIEGKGNFTKHMLRLRQESSIAAPEAHEIILINSHDGTSSYQMLGGMFRFACCNGMVTGDIIEDIRVPHRGNIVDNVIEATYRIVDQYDQVDKSLDLMKSTALSEPEQEIFAKAALELKYEPGNAPVSPYRIIQPNRSEDRKNDVWTTMNRVQENLMNGGQRGRSASGRNVKTRAVNSIDNNIKLNRALWILADEMAKLKGN